MLLVFLISLSDSKSPQDSRTLLSTILDLNSVVIWMVLILPLISNSFSLLSKHFVTDPRTPATIGITVTFIFYWYFGSLAKSKYLSIFLLSFVFTLWSARMANYTGWQVLLLLFTPIRVFHTSVSRWFLTKFEWQRVSSSLQDSSQYSDQSQQCSSLDGLHSSFYFQVLQSLYQSFGDCTKCTNHNWYNHQFHVSQFFQFPSKVQVFIFLFFFFQFYSVVSRDSKIHNSASSFFFFFFVDYYKFWSFY